MKAETALKQESPGHYRLAGDLTVDTVSGVFRKTPRLLAGETGVINLDVATAGRTDSGGLALLLEWQARAAENDQQISVSGASPELLSLAALCGADNALGLSHVDEA